MPASVTKAIQQNTNDYVCESTDLLQAGRLFHLLSPIRLGKFIWDIFYIFIQAIIILIFKPAPPKAQKTLSKPRGRIAVIGAGITGVSSAAHAIAHGFEVVVFEAAPKSKLGGIWAQVNRTSGLQLNSLLYRFHPAVLWSRAFPLRDEILGEVKRIWKEYHLDARTRFETKVTSVKRAPRPEDESEWADDPDRSRWIINDGEEGVFDAVIVTIGTCGDPNWITLPGMPDDIGQETPKAHEADTPPSQDTSANSDQKEQGSSDERENGEEKFTKTILHSSQLDSPAFKLKGGERVVIIGSGASGVEAVETVLEKEKEGVKVYMIARDDKWIIPRNIMIDTFISGQPFGRQMPLSFLWEEFLRRWQYWGVEELVPKDRGIYEGTPVVNDVFLSHVRSRRCHYVRGQPVRLTKDGVVVTSRKSKRKNRDAKEERKPKDGSSVEDIPEGEEKLYEADIIVFATGYKKPSVDFLPQDLFPEGYQRPDLYLQNFSTEDWSILMTNSAYMNAIGTVHIGIYTRILLTLLMDPSARPSPKDMKLWVDVLQFIKRGATGGALGFFTYMELTIWLLGFHILRPDRLRWLFFIMNGWGIYAQ
ncbi:hypothetical protein NLJ89_g5390 [Agrocybe chaxingu]|uniref:FAD/NAD(P)-binding domain-containing protein n=1 Tax=Agrocybe chaxingu TaxID=84603 RepID=A0A9W8K8C4_9AGAR|nr:hypothetical protein NLJ89_g5390 [Agrocybe chaxingu]